MSANTVSIIKTRSDGSCLFHAISYAVGISVPNLRKAVSEMVTQDEFEIKKESMSNEKGYEWLKNINTLDEYKQVISSESAKIWGDTETICHLEYLLNCEIVLFDGKNIINHGYVPDKKRPPKFYILLFYTGDHFELITFQNLRCLTRSEVRKAVEEIKKYLRI